MATWTITPRLALSKTFRVVAVAAVACAVGTPGVQQCVHVGVLGRHTAPAQAARGCHRRHRHLRPHTLNCSLLRSAGCAVPLCRAVRAAGTPSGRLVSPLRHSPVHAFETAISTSVADESEISGAASSRGSDLSNRPRLRAWLQVGPFHGFVGRSGDYLCRLPTRVFVPLFSFGRATP